MARKRDPQQLLNRAQQMEEEARRIREEADRIRREREAKEDRNAGALLRRFWKSGWAGVELRYVIETSAEVFGESPEKTAAVHRSGEPGGSQGASPSKSERGVGERPAEVTGGLFGDRLERTDGGA
ncbi:MAG: hypothetical protein SCH98_15335 [Deferrisomatales bacterium]|nr:hypothetical protein [Deferrisomatales bacterium]